MQPRRPGCCFGGRAGVARALSAQMPVDERKRLVPAGLASSFTSKGSPDVRGADAPFQCEVLDLPGAPHHEPVANSEARSDGLPTSRRALREKGDHDGRSAVGASLGPQSGAASPHAPAVAGEPVGRHGFRATTTCERRPSGWVLVDAFRSAEDRPNGICKVQGSGRFGGAAHYGRGPSDSRWRCPGGDRTYCVGHLPRTTDARSPRECDCAC